MTYTPPPWRYITYGHPKVGPYSGFITGSTPDNTYTIAEVVDHPGTPDSMGEYFDNGPVLAAAPEMLEAHREISRLPHGLGCPGHGARQLRFRCNCYVGIAKRVIAINRGKDTPLTRHGAPVSTQFPRFWKFPSLGG